MYAYTLKTNHKLDSTLIVIETKFMHEKSKIPFSYMLYAYSVKRAYRGTKPKESFR